MEPTFKEGQTVIFNKCLENKTNLEIGTPVVYQGEGRMRLAVIRGKKEAPEGLVYQVSPEARPNESNSISPDKILGIYQKETAPGSSQGGVSSEKVNANPFLLLSGILMMAVFVLPMIWWQEKTSLPWGYFWAGALIWSVMIVAKILTDIPLNFLTPILGTIFLSLILGLRTGFFESGIAYLYGKKKMLQATFEQAVAFGIGFGGFEAFTLGLVSFAFTLLFLIRPDFVQLFPENLRQQFELGYSASSWIVPVPFVERVAALFIHILAMVLVFLAIRTGQLKYFWYSVLYKTLADGMILPLTKVFDISAISGVYLIEIPIVILGLIGLWGVLKIRKIYPRDVP